MDSLGVLGEASALPGAPLIAGLAGISRPRWSVRAVSGPGLPRRLSAPGRCSTYASATIGRTSQAWPGGTFPIVAWSQGGNITWGIEAIMMSAGSCVEWLRDISKSCPRSPNRTGWPPRAQTRVRLVRARATWSRHAAVGLRCPRHVVGPHAGIRQGRNSARGTGGDRAPGRRPSRSGRDGLRPLDRRRFG